MVPTIYDGVFVPDENPSPLGIQGPDTCSFYTRSHGVFFFFFFFFFFFLYMPKLNSEYYWQGSDRRHCACWFLYVSTIL
jgi:hypothetical protein